MASLEEAETALLTIGAVLEWMPVKPYTAPGRVWDAAKIENTDSCHTYQVEFNRNYDPLVLVTVDSLHKHTEAEQDSEHWFNSIAEAKAACEVHAATGVFPPSAKPLVAPV